jgi:hypothetical protein
MSIGLLSCHKSLGDRCSRLLRILPTILSALRSLLISDSFLLDLLCLVFSLHCPLHRNSYFELVTLRHKKLNHGHAPVHGDRLELDLEV